MAATPSSSSFSSFSLPSSRTHIRATEFARESQHSITIGGGRRRYSGRLEIVCSAMLKPRTFMQRRRRGRKVEEPFGDAAERSERSIWRSLMLEIEKSESAVPVLRSYRPVGHPLPKDLVIGTLVRFKQMQKWNLVSEILEWLRNQHWWSFSEMDFLMLMTAYGKLGDFNRAERVLKYMNKKGYPPSVISHTALMEAYGRSGQCNKAESIFRRMQLSGPEPSPVTCQIMLKTFVKADKYSEASEIFQTLLNNERASFKPDQKMFHMMIYMHKKAGDYKEARRIFAQMTERGIPRTTVTFNSLMSFERDYKEVSDIYDQMQRAGLRPDVVSYALLISAYGRARREAQALAVFEEMLDAGVRPTRKAYNILLDAFAISGMIEEARTVFKCMRRDRIYPDLCSYATMLSTYVNALDMEGAEKFFKRIKQDGFEPNQVVYGTLVKGYANTNNLKRMMQVYEEMCRQGIKANQTILTKIMDAYGKNSDFSSAVMWYKEMESCGFPPDKKAKNVLLSLGKTPEEKAEANELVGNTIPRDDILHEDPCNSNKQQMGISHAKKTNFDKFSESQDEDEDSEEEDGDGDAQLDDDGDLNLDSESLEDNEEVLELAVT